ncbi:Elongator complex protein 4 [Glomus cerebriforme]|uniref:Elongator complex protein 4 n=1 Tax=Glomus cerebriforme TaxID=658196 RepID=A0A397T5X6_9GLOM|nr:Elongator complex protein 4 [Glomus cerebriforme]
MSSFKKKVQTSQAKLPQGTRLSPYNGQLLISTGLPSLDDILGGGIPIGSVLLIKEDRHTEYARLLLKYFLAQGIASGHHVLLSTLEEDSKNFMMGLPWLVNEIEEDDDNEESITQSEEKMIIAWRYKGLKKFESSVKNKPNIQNKFLNDSGIKSQQSIEKPFRSTFDLTKLIPQNIIMDNTLVTMINLNKKSDEIIGNYNPYNALLDKIRKIIEENHFNSLLNPPSNVERNALRIGIHSISSPSWQSNSSHDLFVFLHALRGLLRFSFGAAVITIPAHLYTSSSSETSSFIRRIEHMCDAVVEVESFAGSPATTNAIYSATYHGLFHVHKLPTLNSLVPPSTKLSVLSGGGNNLGFKLRRKKFTIETFHLPPEGGVNERRVTPNQSKKKVDKNKDIGISGSGCGTIPGRKVDPYDF